jgi:DNA-binding winged helix-turn-helix (wHTH) protein/TolB-like protein
MTSTRFANLELTAAGELFRDGAPLHLQPQPTKVLMLLVARAGALVTREELQRHVWSDGTFVDFDQSLNWCIRRIREVLGDDASSPRFIQTLPRRGYRFIGEIVHDRPIVVQPRAQTRRWPLLAAALMLALSIGGIRARDSRVSVLVLPFDDLGGAAYAQDVATEEVIHALAKLDPPRLGVIDPLTAMKFKKSGECIVELGRQLESEYVLLGAVRRAGEHLRVTAQLFRVADNQQAWAGEEDVAASADPTLVYARIAQKAAATLGISAKTQSPSID